MPPMPPVPVGVPWRVAVPLPLSLKVTPVGSAPVSVMLGVGAPVVVTVKKETRPNTKVVVLPLVMVGAVWATAVSTKDAVANPMAAKSAIRRTANATRRDKPRDVCGPACLATHRSNPVRICLRELALDARTIRHP